MIVQALAISSQFKFTNLQAIQKLFIKKSWWLLSFYQEYLNQDIANYTISIGKNRKLPGSYKILLISVIEIW